MDHSEAIGSHAAEKYALGEMDESERDAYEAHFFECEECAQEVKAAARFLEAARPVVGEGERQATEVAARPRPSIAKARWPQVSSLFWPMPLGAAAALLLALGGPAVYLAAVKVPRLERALAEAQSLQPASWHFLSVSRSEPPTVTVSAGEHWVGLSLSRSSEKSFPYYLCEIRDASDRIVLSNVIPGARPDDELQILAPAERLQPGTYVVAIAGLESPSSRTPAAEFTRYYFTFAHDSERDSDRRS